MAKLGEHFFEHVTSHHSSSGRKLSIDSAHEWRDGMLGGLRPEESPPSAFLQQRTLAMVAGVLLIMLVLVGRVFTLQVAQGREYFLRSEENRLRVKRILPERGLIYDSEGTILARNAPGFAVGVDLTGRDVLVLTPVLNKLSEILDVPFERLDERVRQSIEARQQEVILAQGVDRDTVLIIETSLPPTTGIYTEAAPIREYVYGEEFAHVLGYTGEISPAELDEYLGLPYAPGDTVGKDGLERVYEEYVHGIPGKRLIESDAAGNRLREVSTQQASAGSTLTTTLDASLQHAAYEALNDSIEEFEARGGAAIVTDVNSGAVRALVSLPTFDPNSFSQRISVSDYQAIVEDDRLPLFNRAVSGQYPPASTFKIVTATGALEEGVVTPDTLIDEVQTIYVGGSSFSNWTLIWGIAPHGLLDMAGAIAQSSDIYFYEVGGGYESQPGIGEERLAYWSRSFGFGSTTGIDLEGESAGVVADAKFKQEVKGEQWYLGDTYISAIGQGDMQATPLQVANATAVVANNGTLYRPYLVEKVVALDGSVLDSFTPTALKTGIGSSDTLGVVRQGMREAVEYGTAVELKGHPGQIAAKTGTAETGDDDRIHAWFTAFAPYNNPEIAVTVFVEEGGSGSDAALPVAKAIFDEYFEVSPSE